MNGNRKLKVGVVGVGSLGQHHARIYSELRNAELVGIYDANPARAEEIAAKHGTRAFNSLDDLATVVEAVSVAVPTDKHIRIFHELAPKNIHLLMEKPIASTSAEAEEMVRIANEKKLILQVGHVERFNPVMQFLEEHLSSPKFIEVTRLGTFPTPGPDGRLRGTEVSVVLDLMIHDLEIILHLVRSKPKEIRAIGVPVLSLTEDIANVRILFENGCVANVTASRISRERVRKIRIFQSDTYVSLDYMNQAGQMCRRAGGKIETSEVPIDRREPLAAELESFVSCVLTHGQPVVTGYQASEALKLAIKICDTIRNSPS